MAPNLKAAQARSDNLAKARRASTVILEEVPDPAREWLPPIDEEAEAAHLDWSDFEDNGGEDAEEAEKGCLNDQNESNVTIFSQILTTTQQVAVEAKNAKRKTKRKRRYTKNAPLP
ncbi:hypothetical protein BC835DRAFT_1303581 [Cytidiella melzeri]|nr:hypothetical protein BC835DRAFT_1303581 [Cytidiella melzeri]